MARGRPQHRAAGIARSGFHAWPPRFDYHRPLRFEDEFDVRIRIVGISEKAIRYVCELTQDGTRIATGTQTVVCVRTDVTPLKASPIPPEIAARFEVAAGDAS